MLRGSKRPSRGGFRAVTVLSLLLAACTAGCGSTDREDAAAPDVLTLATTTSTDNSGLLAQIHPDFEKRTGIKVKVVAKGTGASLQLARDGNADVVLVHAPGLERKFVEKGYGVKRHPVMYNDFVIIGPKSDPAGITNAENPAHALMLIADAEHDFVSRGDQSGTHEKEQYLWAITGNYAEPDPETFVLRPTGDWYLSIGQGMGKTISVATEKQAYTLADRGTYYAFALSEPARTDLAILYEGGDDLHNPYSVIAVSPNKHPGVNFEAATKYIEWITSADVQEMIGQYTVQGKMLFHSM
ncbi:MAG TPA: substrate-binding domain-containing protein [Thermoguttaceae bacterium]|nr:substrate-binding domain-containing protein [Thermoguttaceae bacterium]